MMRTHPRQGYDALAAEGSFPPEMLMWSSTITNFSTAPDTRTACG